MAKAKLGDTVKVHYRGFFDDGTEFDSSFDREPFEFVLGADMVIPGFENAVVGMEVGETRTIHISPEEGYGEHRDDLVIEIEKSKIPPHINPEVGLVLQVSSDDGEISHVTVTAVNEDSVTLDGNHPLAGKELNFEIQLVEIV